MRYGVRIICGPEVAPGFALAGLPTIAVDRPADAANRIDELMRQADTGVVLVEERLHDALPPALHRQLAKQPLPMLVPFPGPTWRPRREGAEAYIVDLLRRAIGYRVRLR